MTCLVTIFVALNTFAQLVGVADLEGLTSLVDPCEAQLGKGYYKIDHDGEIQFGQNQSSAKIYSERYTLYNVNLEEEQILQMSGDVLLVGEGDGYLLPIFVRAPNVNVTAVDPMYGIEPPAGTRGDRLRQFVKTYKRHLRIGTSTNLPVDDESVNYVYSHFLVNNLSDQEVINTLRDTIRVLRSGGKAIHAGTTGPKRAQELLVALEKSYGSSRLTYEAYKESYIAVNDLGDAKVVVRILINKK